MGRSDEFLSAEKRVAYYRTMAAQALHLAQTASDDAQKASYIDIAAQWNTLASDVERHIARESEAIHHGRT